MIRGKSVFMDGYYDKSGPFRPIPVPACCGVSHSWALRLWRGDPAVTRVTPGADGTVAGGLDAFRDVPCKVRVLLPAA